MQALLLDTETTGLPKSGLAALNTQPEITELFMCLANIDTGKIEAELDELIQPHYRSGRSKNVDDAMKVSKLTYEMLAGKPRFADKAACVFSWIESAPLVIAHNASFDKEILDNEAARLSRKINWPPLLCTVEQTIHLKGWRLSLSELYETLFGEKFKDAHRAKGDVMALLRCCVELRKLGTL